MKKNSVTVDLKDRNYKIIIKDNITEDVVNNHKTLYPISRAFFITDENVSSFYLKRYISCFEKANIKCESVIIKAGESSKSFKMLENISTRVLRKKISRQDVIYALGGGVVGDLAGFLSSIMLRGIRFIQLPTTLLAQVDSSVGGKTGINTSLGKNLIGSFYQPEKVFIDPKTILTLNNEDFLSGYAEVVKYALIDDLTFFKWLHLNYNLIKKKGSKEIKKIITLCCKKKAAIVRDDEKEQGKRMFLNLGHTFGHAIEAELNYKIKHGLAIALGMLIAMKLSVLLKKSDINDFMLLKKHYISMSLPTSFKKLSLNKKWSADRLIEKMQNDKKVLNNKLRLVLCNGIGNVSIENNVSNEFIKKSIIYFM